jgi:hypothetical protein
MRELVYLSRTKLDSFHLPPRRLPGLSGEVEFSIPGTRFRVGGSGSGVPATDAATILPQVAKHLRKKAKEATDPSLGAGEWFSFDAVMSLGTVGRRSRTAVVVFIDGDYSTRPLDSGQQPGGLVLCGSPHHLTTDIGTVTAFGSSLSWLSRVVGWDEESDTMADRGRPPLFLDDTVISGNLVEALWTFKPTQLNVRFSGLAKALYVGYPAPTEISVREARSWRRTVLATPLYVENGPWNPKW